MGHIGEKCVRASVHIVSAYIIRIYGMFVCMIWMQCKKCEQTYVRTRTNV